MSSDPNSRPIVRRDPRTGQVIKGSAGIGGGRRKSHKNYLKGLLGDHGERAYDIALDIAEGRLTFEQLTRKPGAGEDAVSASLIPTVKVVPSIRERLDAAIFLAEQLNGKATVSVDVEHTHTTEGRDYSRLDDGQLETLERLLSEADADVVEGELVPPTALPEGQNT